jgi:uncharacterized protein YdaT
MTITTTIILVVAIVAVAAFIAYNMQKGTKALSEFKADYDNNAEAQEIVELAQELYNKDLRPVVAKKAPKAKKSEFPIDQPTKKTKAVEQVETIAEVVTPEVVETVKTVEAVVEPAKPKKKRKYYPRKPKTSI